MASPPKDQSLLDTICQQTSRTVPADQFIATRWSVVLKAGASDESEESRRALEQLCSAYWYPLYVFVRRSGKSVDDAQDLTQGFFAQLLSKGGLAKADGERGSFRSFLLKSLKNYMTSEWRRESAKKRGGDSQIFSLDGVDAERRYQFEPASGELTPEALYDRRWARAVLEQVFDKMRDEFRRSKKEERFDRLKPHLLSEAESGDYEKRAVELGLSISGVRTQIQRMRARFGYLLREEIAETVADPNRVDEELSHLVHALA